MVRNSYKKRQGLVFASYCLTIKDMLAICRKKSGKNLNSLFFIATATFARPNSKKYIMYVLFWRKSEINLTIWRSVPRSNQCLFKVSLELKVTFWWYIKITWLRAGSFVAWFSLILNEEAGSHPSSFILQVNKISRTTRKKLQIFGKRFLNDS